MARKSVVPVYAPEETTKGFRTCAVFTNLLGIIGSIIFLIAAGKKSQFVKDHCKQRIQLVIWTVIQVVILSVASTLLAFTLVVPIICAIGASIQGIVFVVETIVMIVRAADGRFTSAKRTREAVRAAAFAGNEVAINIIKTDPKYYDILAEYNKTFANVTEQANDSTVTEG